MGEILGLGIHHNLHSIYPYVRVLVHLLVYGLLGHKVAKSA